jgi:predicted metal-binding membrane protein
VRIDPAVLRRDRIIINLALVLLTALAWSYLLWLSVDMQMGGMDMSGFRMVPSGMGLMMPAHAPWGARHSVGRNRLVRCWLFPCVGRFLATRYPGALGI